MNTPSNATKVTMPRMLPTLVAGFNTVAGHIQLILLPLVIDLILWLGPKLRITALGQPFIDYLTKNMQPNGAAITPEQVKQVMTYVTQFFDQFNLAVAIRTLPVGLPSLLAREVTIKSPLGGNMVFEAPTAGYAFLVVLALVLVGFFLGTLYFNTLARYTVTPTLPQNNKKFFMQYGQNLVTALILIAILVIIMIPGMMIMTVAYMISPAIGQFLVLIVMFILLWLAVPLVFAPHGIFVLNQKAYPSMLLSIRMVRFFLPGAGMFVMTAALISEGLNMLWIIPDPTSWLTLIGIFGHAFVVTALLAASFIYYRGGLKWMQESIQNISDPIIKADLGGPFGTTKQ